MRMLTLSLPVAFLVGIDRYNIFNFRTGDVIEPEHLRFIMKVGNCNGWNIRKIVILYHF